MVRYRQHVVTRAGLVAWMLTVSGAASCVPTVDIPPAPDLQPVLAAYDDPTADVRSEIMDAHGDAISELRANLEESRLFAEILDVIIAVEEKLDEVIDEDRNLILDGNRFRQPNGVIEIDRTCRGWGETERDSPDNGTILLTMPLNQGAFGPLVWGALDRCRYLTPGGLRASYDGEVALHFGEFVSPDRSVRDLLATFVLAGKIGIGERRFRAEQSFRAARGGDRLDILVEIDDRETFVYFFGGDTLDQGIRDTTGTFGCSLEERECVKPSGSFSW